MAAASFHNSYVGPRGSTFLDLDQAAKISPATLAEYRKAARAFSFYCSQVGRVSAVGVDDWDDLLVEHKNASRLSKTQFTYLLAAVRFFHPRFLHSLQWSEAKTTGRERRRFAKHAVPPAVGSRLPCMESSCSSAAACGLLRCLA